MVVNSQEKYSRCPKSGRLDFCVFKNRPVPKHSGFQTLSEIRTIMSGFRTFGSFTLHLSGFQTLYSYNFGRLKSGHKCPDFRRSRPKPVWNRFQTGFGTRFVSDVRLETISDRFQTFSNQTTSSKPVPNRFRNLVVRLETIGTGRPITGGWNWKQYCPDLQLDMFRKRRNPDVRISDIYCIIQIQ